MSNTQKTKPPMVQLNAVDVNTLPLFTAAMRFRSGPHAGKSTHLEIRARNASEAAIKLVSIMAELQADFDGIQIMPKGSLIQPIHLNGLGT